MALSNSLWTAPSLQRYRFPLVAITCLAAGATIYYAQTLYSARRGSGGSLHRSNAGRRRRQRRSLGAVPDSEGHERAVEALDTRDQTSSLPLDVAETDTDGVSDYSWDGQDDGGDKEGQGLLLLLYKIAEEQSRKDGYVHRGVSCNSCNEHPIKGIRYRCANCADYDLCETCEAAHTHNREHLFWKIRIPAPQIGGSNKERLPLFYPGKPKATIQDLQRGKVEYFCKETGYKAEEVEALWEQFRSMAAVEYRNDPDHYGLAIDRLAFDKCFVPRSSSRPPTPNLLYSRIFSYYDTNNDGLIGFGEFIRGLASFKKKNAKERLKRVFKSFDINDDGYVDRRDFLRIFRAYYNVTKDFMSDIVACMEEEDDQDTLDLITSSQPISAGFNGPGVMRRDGRPNNDTGKARDGFGDVEIMDGMGIIRDHKSDPQSELNSIIGDNAEQAIGGSKPSPFPPTGSLPMTGQAIHSVVTHASRKDIQIMLGHYGKHDFPSGSDSNEEVWNFLRRELQGYLALELLQRRKVRRTAIIQRLQRQSYYQDGDVTWQSWDAVAPQDFGDLNADPRLHTQMEKDLRDIESSQLKSLVKKDLCELVKNFGWPINDTLGFGTLLLGLVKEGWTQDEIGKALDGYSPDPSQVLEFVKSVVRILAKRASKAQADEQDFTADPLSSNSSQLRLGNEQWACPEGTDLELMIGQDILLSVTEEALNELLDPVFKLREDLALMAMWERRQRDVFRDKIIDALRSSPSCYILKHSLQVYCRQWRQKNDPSTLTVGSLASEVEQFKKFLRFMLSGEVNSVNSRRCEECFKHDHESWVRIGEICSQRKHHSKTTDRSERSRFDDRKLRPAEKCPDCSLADKECWILDLYCDRCGRPSTRIKREELKIRYSIETGGKSLIRDIRSEDSQQASSRDDTSSSQDQLSQHVDEAAEKFDEDRSRQEPASLSANTHFLSSQPGSPNSLCDDTPLEFDDFDDIAESSRDRIPMDSRDRNSKRQNAPKPDGELGAQAGHDFSEPQALSSKLETQRPDPTLPQNRPTTVQPQMPSFCVLPPSITFSATAGANRAEPSKDKAPERIQHREPYVPSDTKLKFWMCMDILEGDDQERGGPGRINFEEFEELMQGEKGPTLGFLASWVDIGTF